MRIEPDPDHQAFVAQVEDFLAGHWPEGASAAIDAHRRAFLDALAQRGWGAPEWPARFGGAALGRRQAFLLDRKLAAVGAPRPDPQVVDLAGPLIRSFGSAEQQARWLPALSAGRAIWVLHGSLGGGEPLVFTDDRDGPRVRATIRAHGAAAADWLLGLGLDPSSDRLSLLAGRMTAAAVTPGLPLDPDEVALGAVRFEHLGRPRPQGRMLDALARARTDAARSARCRSAAMRRTANQLARMVATDDAMARRLYALEVDLLGLEVLEQRAHFPPGKEDEPDPVLLTALTVRAGELGAALSGLAVEALGYHALPAPDPLRQHNELPAPGRGDSASGLDAIGALIRYVDGLDALGARDRLAALTGAHEG